jgi:hypothetical protein
MPRQKKLLKELFIMTYKKMSYKGSNRKRTQRVNRSITTRENKGANTQEPKEKRRKNTIVIVKNFNKMSIKNHNYLKNYRQMKHIYTSIGIKFIGTCKCTTNACSKTIEINIDSKCRILVTEKLLKIVL